MMTPSVITTGTSASGRSNPSSGNSVVMKSSCTHDGCDAQANCEEWRAHAAKLVQTEGPKDKYAGNEQEVHRGKETSQKRYLRPCRVESDEGPDKKLEAEDCYEHPLARPIVHQERIKDHGGPPVHACIR